MRILGLDLGQAQDPAAAVVADRVVTEPANFIGPRNPRFKMQIRVRAIRTWPLGTDYNDIVSDVLDPGLAADVIVPDFGGVGRPVVDMLRKQALQRNFKGKIKPVQLTGSAARVKQKQEARGQHWNVPKIDVVMSAIIAQQQGYLYLPNVPEVPLLLKQLRDFQMRFTKAANLQFGNLPGGHDDLVIALGLVCWWAQRFGLLRPAIYIG